MQVTETLSDGLKRAYTVVVPAAELDGRRMAKLTQLGKSLRIPGFRPGKVPMPVVRQRYGTAVSAEVLEESVSEATRQMISERGLRPAMQPKVDLVHAGEPAEAQDLEFKVEMELLPEIQIPDLGTIALTRLRSDVPEERVETTLADLAGRSRTMEDVEESRPAQSGDFVKVDFIGRVDGVPFDGGTGTDMDVEVGGGGFIPGFTEKLEGISPGEIRTIDVTFPAEYHAAELAGKAAQFEIAAKGLRRAVLPPIDDALAEKFGFDSLDKLREAIRQNIQREYDQMSRMKLKRELLDVLSGMAQFTPPETMVQAEFDQIWRRIEADRKEDRLDAEDKAKDEETLRGEYRAIADRRVRLGLLLAEIGRANSLTVGNDEMQRAMRAEASRYPGQEATVMEFFRKNPQAADGLRGPLFEDKVVDFILELARVEDSTVSPEELAKEPETA